MSDEPTKAEEPEGFDWGFTVAIAAFVAMVVGVACFFVVPKFQDYVEYSVLHKSRPTQALANIPPKNREPLTGGVTLGFPKGTTVIPAVATVKPADRKAFNTSAKGVSALTDPVDIKAVDAKRPLPNKQVVVSFAYDPAKLPKGVTPTNLGISVYDTGLKVWVPLLDAKANSTTNTIDAVAPHFSEYVATFLDAAKSVVQVGGKAIKTVINGTISTVVWLSNLVDQLVNDAAHNLIGTGPELACKPKSADLQVSVDAILHRLTGCTEGKSGKNETLRLANGYGFPILSDPLPKGYAINKDDALTSGDDVVSLVRSWFWATRGRDTISATETGDVTVTTDLKSSAKAAYQLDGSAVQFDLIVSFLLALAPAGKAYETLITGSFEKFLVSGVKPTKGDDGLIGMTYDVADCAATALHNKPPTQLFQKDTYVYAAQTAEGCLNAALQRFNLESSLAGLLSVLKQVPAVIETALAGAVTKLSLGKVNTNVFTVATKRGVDPKTFAGTWNESTIHAFTINPDGATGVVRIEYGACKGANQFCNVVGKTTVVGAPSGIVITLVSLRYYLTTDAGEQEISRSEFATLANATNDFLLPPVGMQYNMRQLSKGVVAVERSTHEADELGRSYCGSKATAAEWRDKC